MILTEKFIVPPFSLLDSRLKHWQERKKNWLKIGIQSELGRQGFLTYGKSAQSPKLYEIKNKLSKNLEKEPTWDEIIEYAKEKGLHTFESTSIFDPVLCEITYRWFSPLAGSVLDPFCGGSVRGVVAALLGYNYTGIDIRFEQVQANLEQCRAIVPTSLKQPNYWVADAEKVDKICYGQKFDLLFSCPPYFNLEKYSDMVEDLSNTNNYEKFLVKYATIWEKAINLLKDNRFAVVVVSDVRDKKGYYNSLTADTIAIFKEYGMNLYNEFIYINSAGSLPIRCSRPFQGSRKNGRMHQKMLVFYKGDTTKIREDFGDVFTELPTFDFENE